MGRVGGVGRVGLLLVCLLTPALGSAQSVRSNHGPVTVTVSGPLVIGFFPPYSKEEESSDGVIEGLAHVRYAVQDISKCLQRANAVYRLDVTRRVTLRDGMVVRNIAIPSDWGHSVGLIFASAGRPPRVVFATDGPGSLLEAGPAEAAEYFDALACRGTP
jgi:hypothetical protein